MIQLLLLGAAFGVLWLGAPWVGEDEYVRAACAGALLAVCMGQAIRYGVRPLVVYLLRRDTAREVQAATRNVKEWGDNLGKGTKP